MSELTADLFVSLDGFASAVNVGPYFGYGGPELDNWIQSELDKPQLIVFGRVTYDALAAISSTGSDPASRRLTESPKAVVSSTLSEPLEWANTRLVAGDAIEALPALKRDSEVPIRTMGSLSLVRNLAGAGLVDRLRLMIFPLTCGSDGRERMFED
jgi:dihydrofolate reductase